MMHNLELIIAQQKQVISKLNARKSEQSCLWLRNIDNWLRYNQTIYFYFKISSIPLRNNENLNMYNILPKILSHSRRVCPKSCFDKPIQNQKTNYLGNSNIKMTPLLGRQVGRQVGRRALISRPAALKTTFIRATLRRKRINSPKKKICCSYLGKYGSMLQVWQYVIGMVVCYRYGRSSYSYLSR